MKNPWIMLVWLLCAQVGISFVTRSLGPLAPFLQDDFDLTKAQIGLLPAALFAGQAMMSLPGGWLSDRFGTRKMILILTLLCGGIFFSISFVSYFWLILLGIVLGGLCNGAMVPTTNRGIIDWFSAQRTGTAMGIKQMGVSGGSALAALILVPISVSGGWRLAMAGSAGLLLAIGILTFIFYHNSKDQSMQSNKLPFLPLCRQLMANKPLVMMSITAVFLSSAQLSLITYIILFVAESLLYPLVVASIFLFLSELGGSLGRIIWGIISDRVFNGERLPVLLTIAVITAGCSTAVAFLPANVSLWLLVPLIFLFGFCISGYNGLWMNVASETVPRAYAGISSGFSLSLGSMGVLVGTPLFGAIIDLTGGYREAWLLVTVEMGIVIGLLLFMQLKMGKGNVSQQIVYKHNRA